MLELDDVGEVALACNTVPEVDAIAADVTAPEAPDGVVSGEFAPSLVSTTPVVTAVRFWV